jgi:hypothetical protein
MRLTGYRDHGPSRASRQRSGDPRHRRRPEIQVTASRQEIMVDGWLRHSVASDPLSS